MAKKKISVKFSPKNKKDGGSLSFARQKSDPVPRVNDSPPPDISERVSETDYHVMAFRIHDRWFALKQHLVYQVASFVMPRALPGKTNEVFLGLVYAAGASYPCFSFYGLLEMIMPDESSLRRNGQPRLIVAGTEEERWSFMVEEMMIAAISTIPEQEEKTVITTARGDITVLQSFDLHGKKVGLLDGETLFAVLSRSLLSDGR